MTNCLTASDCDRLSLCLLRDTSRQVVIGAPKSRLRTVYIRSWRDPLRSKLIPKETLLHNGPLLFYICSATLQSCLNAVTVPTQSQMTNGAQMGSDRPAGKQSKPGQATSVKNVKNEIEENNRNREARFKFSLGYLTGVFGLLL